MEMEKENVYEKTEKVAEDVAVAETDEGEKIGPKEALTALKKFKDVDALAKAYSSLEAEFTRRSQRLKELETLAENFSKEKATAEASGAEKLRKNADARREERKKFDDFIAEVGRESSFALENEKPERKENLPVEKKEADNVSPMAGREKFAFDGTFDREFVENQKGADTVAFEIGGATNTVKAKPDVSVADRGNAESSADVLYQKVLSNEEVRLKIIGEYLTSLGKSGAPITVGGAGAFASPPARIGSIGDAGKMALRYFEKSSEK